MATHEAIKGKNPMATNNCYRILALSFLALGLPESPSHLPFPKTSL